MAKKPIKSCGVYALIHKPSRAAYIGGSVWIEQRFSYHKAMLKRPWHHNKPLLTLWKRTKPNEWKYVILELCSKSKLDETEQWWMDNYKGKILNVHPKAGTPRGSKMPFEARIKMSLSALRVAADPAERKRRSERAKKQHTEGNLGRKTWSPEATASALVKMAIVAKRRRGVKFNDEARAKQHAAWTPKRRKEQSARIKKINANRPEGTRKGHKASPETRAKQRASWTPEKRAAQSARITKINLRRRNQ